MLSFVLSYESTGPVESTSRSWHDPPNKTCLRPKARPNCWSLIRPLRPIGPIRARSVHGCTDFGQARAAEKLPWDRDGLLVYRTIS